MANKIDSEKLTQLIQNATRELVNRTESYADKYPEADESKVDENEVVFIQFNTKKVAIPKDEYAKLKELNDATRTTMEDELKKIMDEVSPVEEDPAE